MEPDLILRILVGLLLALTILAILLIIGWLVADLYDARRFRKIVGVSHTDPSAKQKVDRVILDCQATYWALTYNPTRTIYPEDMSDARDLQKKIRRLQRLAVRLGVKPKN